MANADINDILAELNKVLSKLTGDERKSVRDDFRSVPKKTQQLLPAPAQKLKREPVPTPKIMITPAPVAIPCGAPSGQVLKLACYYPAGGVELREIFFQNLADVVQKTTKKSFYIEQTFVQEVKEADYKDFDFGQAAEECQSRAADAVFFISKQPLEFRWEGIFCRNVTEEQVKRRFFYVDLVVEVILSKKK